MFCQRCRGLMVRDRFMDFWDEGGQMYFSGWRCVVCGEIVDSVILANRTSPPVLRKKHARHRMILSI
jgi:hypothetical protein